MFADGNASANFTGYNLDRGGEYLRLAMSDQTQLVAQGFGLQATGTAQGFQPEGSATLATFVPTLEAPNSTGTGPTITRHPRSQTASADSSVSLSVLAVNATSYVWKRNGVIVPGGTASTLLISPVTIGDDGVYICEVTGPGG